MTVVWTLPAARDLYRIAKYIAKDSPASSRKVIDAMREGCLNLVRMPLQGRLGKVDGTRELLFVPLPYVVVYRVREEVVEILRVWHGAQSR